MYLSRLVACSALIAGALAQNPPATKVAPVTETIHGVAITDPYRWLEDQDSAETRAWINAQIRHTESMVKNLPARDRIKRRLEELRRVETVSIPVSRKGRYFLTKRKPNENRSAIYMRTGLKGEDELLVDPVAISPDPTVSIFMGPVSRDGKILVYNIRQGGEDEVQVVLRDVDTKKDLADRLPKGRYSGVALLPDRSGIYYSRFTREGPRVFRHVMGTDTAQDKMIFGKEYGPKQIIGTQVSSDGKYLRLTVQHGVPAERVEIFVQDLKSNGPIRPIVTGIEATFQGGGRIIGDKLYVQTNLDAPNWRILEIDLKRPQRQNWRDFVPERTVAIQSFSVAGGRFFVSYLDNVVSRIDVFDAAGKKIRDIKAPSLGTLSGGAGDWEEDEAFYSFSSFAEPETVYLERVSTGKAEVWRKAAVPVKSDEIEVKQVWFGSKDGTRVPMFLVHRKGLKLDGNRPVYLTGYGGFNLARTSSFTETAIVWAEMGGVYAVPNLRGGGEFGERWHRAGMFENKQNVFDDFIGAAEWLIANQYTRPDRLAIAGGSNGGLLVGAALTQRPDLFRAVICGAPLLDMVRYQQFKVARWWVSEYGSSENPKQFPYILKYSPYHNVKKGTNYPSVMFTTGDADTRVDPLHARKMAALMQASTASGRPILLDYDTKAGHSGGRPLDAQIDNSAMSLAFLLWQLGADKEPSSGGAGLP